MKKCGIRTAIFSNLTKNKKELGLKMHDIQVKLGIKSMSDLVRKEIHGIFNTKNPTEEQIWSYKAWIDDGLYIIAELALKIIMHCRLSPEETEKFRSELGFKQHNILMTNEQSVLKSIKDAFEGENMQTQYSDLGFKTDLYFCDYKLAIEVDEKGHKYRDINHETERQKAIEKEL